MGNKKINRHSNKPYKIVVNGLLTNGQSEEFYNLIYDTSCNINDIIIYLLNLFDSLDNKKSDKYITRILLGINIILDTYAFTDANAEPVITIRKLEEKYNSFLSQTEREANEEVKTQIQQIKSVLEEYYPIQEQNEDNDSDELKALKRIISEQNIKIDYLNTKLDEWIKLCSEAKKYNKKAQGIIANKKREIESLEKEINDKSKQIEKLTQTIISKDEQISLLQSQLSQQNERIERLEEQKRALSTDKQKLISDLNQAQNETVKQKKIADENNQQLVNLQEVVEMQKKSLSESEQIILKEKEIDDYILQKLFNEGYTIDQIANEIASDGLKYSKEEIKSSLLRLKAKINIEPSTLSFPVEYKVCSPSYSVNNNFQINTNDQCYDILLTADWHVTSSNITKCLNIANDMYDYCVKKGITMILNLGDFLDAMQKSKSECYNENMKLMNILIEKFPSHLPISNVLLGGNHEKKVLEAGIDPLKYISSHRDDFINLGYNYANVFFNGGTEKQIIGVHHPDKRILQIGDINDSTGKTSLYLKEHYLKYNINATDIYMDLFGHFHAPRIDVANGYAYIPSLVDNFRQHSESIWHLKIYFDNKRNIKYIIIKTLTHVKNFEPIVENVYQKVRK